MKEIIKFILLTVLSIVCLSCNDKSDLRPDGPKLKIGDKYHGGAVFYVEPNGQHGLVVIDAIDVNYYYYYNPTAVWASSFSTTSATNDGIYSGENNTNLIVSFLGSGSYAARMCYDGSSSYDDKKTDWYLPSKYELNLLFLQNNNIPAQFRLSQNTRYWSSTEFSSSQAWCQYISGTILNQLPANKTQNYNFKAIRKF